MLVVSVTAVTAVLLVAAVVVAVVVVMVVVVVVVVVAFVDVVEAPSSTVLTYHNLCFMSYAWYESATLLSERSNFSVGPEGLGFVSGRREVSGLGFRVEVFIAGEIAFLP